MLELTVKTLDSQNHSFTVPDETTVRQLKESILEKMEVPVDMQRLIFHGKVLQDEKKLTDYGDVHGKVIHLVQRPPPAPTRNSNSNNATDSNQRSGSRRSHHANRDRMDGSSSTYLGAMAFPTDLIEAQGMIQLPPLAPSQGLSAGRLLLAQRMLNRAQATILQLENNEGHHSNAAESQEPAGASNSSQSNASGSGREEADMFLGETTGSIARAAQAATAAAIAAAVSAAHAVVPHITIRGASGQNDSSLSNLDNSNSNMSDINLNLNINDNHPEDVAVEVEIGANSDVSVEECHEGDSIANNLDNNPSGSNIAPPRTNIARTSFFATLLEQLDEEQQRFRGVLRRCHQLMVDDPPLTENSSPNAEECQRLFNGVSEIMHYFAHAYHTLSDIMVDFNEDTPRTLRCRPVLVQHSAILETVFPIQAQINLSTRRNTNESASNLSAESSQPSVNSNSSNAQTQVETPTSEGTENASHPPSSEPTQTNEGGEENVTPQGSASSFTSTTTQQSEDRPPSSQNGGINNTSGFFLSGPGNLEVFMDLRPESVTLGSVETTVILDNDRVRNNAGGGIQLRNLGTGRTPIDMLQSVQAVAGQIQNHIMGRIYQQPPADQPPPDQTANQPLAEQPPPYEGNVQNSTSESVMSNQSASSRSQSSGSTESANTMPNVSRPRVHIGSLLPDSTLSLHDPYLPCNSHHIRPQNRGQNRNTTAQNAQGATSRHPNENERSNNANGNANPNPERDSFMAMMSQLLNPQRFTINRGQARQGTSTATNSSFSASGSDSRNQRSNQNQNGPAEPNPNELPRSFTWTPLPNNIAGFSVSASPSTSPGSRRNFWDYFRISSRDFPADRSPPPGSTIAEFLSTIYDSSYVEGESIVSDFFMTLARNLTWPDLIELSMARRSMVESIVTRLHPALHAFVVQRLLQGEAPTEENIARACRRLYAELRPYVEVTQVARLIESVDLPASINNFNQSQIPEIIGLVVDPTLNQSPNFGHTMTRRVRNYVRQLIAIIIHCCQDGVQGFDAIVQGCVRLLTRGVPEDLQQWTEVNSVNNLRYYTSTLNVPLEEIQRYFVYRIPNSAAEKTEAAESVPEPMETETSQNRTGWIPNENMQNPEKIEEPLAEPLVELDGDGLPDVLIGSETWHNALPSEWVPIIARDTQRQRRQSSQKPFSDAYLSSLPPKRRKLITSAKPQGSLSQVISDGVRQAISAAGVSSTVAERAIAEAGKDDVLQEAYKEQERLVVSADLRKDPDFTPNRFPNAFKYFDK